MALKNVICLKFITKPRKLTEFKTFNALCRFNLMQFHVFNSMVTFFSGFGNSFTMKFISRKRPVLRVSLGQWNQSFRTYISLRAFTGYFKTAVTVELKLYTTKMTHLSVTNNFITITKPQCSIFFNKLPVKSRLTTNHKIVRYLKSSFIEAVILK